MAKYLLIESRDPFDCSDSTCFAELAEGLAQRGNEIVLFLVQNGVLPTRKASKHSATIGRLKQNKIRVVADGFSLKERAIRNLVDGVEVSDINRLVDLLLEPGTKCIWH